MKPYTLPPVRNGEGRSGSPRRRWFGEQAHALAFALDQSETRRLPFFDLREGEAE